MSWFPKQKVLVPVDFSAQSLAAVDTGLELVASPSGLTAIHVLPELSAGEPGEMWNTVDDSTRSAHASEAIRKQLADAKYAEIGVEIRVGDPGHEIALLAEERGADLIVMPSHGRTGLKRLLVGSVAERVMRLAHCAVLVLRS